MTPAASDLRRGRLYGITFAWASRSGRPSACWFSAAITSASPAVQRNSTHREQRRSSWSPAGPVPSRRSDFPTEADAIARVLLAHGVPKEAIALERLAANSSENFWLAADSCATWASTPPLPRRYQALRRAPHHRHRPPPLAPEDRSGHFPAGHLRPVPGRRHSRRPRPVSPGRRGTAPGGLRRHRTHRPRRPRPRQHPPRCPRPASSRLQHPRDRQHRRVTAGTVTGQQALPPPPDSWTS